MLTHSQSPTYPGTRSSLTRLHNHPSTHSLAHTLVHIIQFEFIHKQNDSFVQFNLLGLQDTETCPSSSEETSFNMPLAYHTLLLIGK